MNFDLIFVGMKLWELDVYGNFVGMCRPYFHGYGNFFCGYHFHGYRKFFVLDICLSHYWMNLWRWGIFGLITILFGYREIWMCGMAFRAQLIFLKGIILLAGILECVLWTSQWLAKLCFVEPPESRLSSDVEVQMAGIVPRH